MKIVLQTAGLRQRGGHSDSVTIDHDRLGALFSVRVNEGTNDYFIEVIDFMNDEIVYQNNIPKG